MRVTAPALDPPTTPRPRWSLRLRIDSEIIRFGRAAHQLDSAQHLAVAVSQVLAANMLAGPMRAAT